MADFGLYHSLVQIKPLDAAPCGRLLLFEQFLNDRKRLVLLLDVGQDLVDDVGRDVAVLVLLVLAGLLRLRRPRRVFIILSFAPFDFDRFFFTFCATDAVLFFAGFFKERLGKHDRGKQNSGVLWLLTIEDGLRGVERRVHQDEVEEDWAEGVGAGHGKLSIIGNFTIW